MRRIVGVLAALGTAGSIAVAAAAPAAATAHHPAAPAAAACSTHWGTNAKHGGSSTPVRTPVLGVRAGKHGCFDRLVVDLRSGPKPPFSVKYVKNIVAQGSGRILKVRGHAKILIVVRGPAGRHFNANAVNLADVSGFKTFRQVRGAGSFEAVTSIGLGVRAKLPFRVFLLGSAKTAWRLVIDVAH
jgi:hypothetical protein